MSYLTFFSSCGHFCTAIIRSCRLVRENGHLWSEINLCEAVMEHFSIFQNFQIFYSAKNHLLKFLKRTMTKLRLKNENSKCKMHACTNFLHYFDIHFRNGSHIPYIIQTANIIIIYRVFSKQITILSFKTLFSSKSSFAKISYKDIEQKFFLILKN